MQSPPCACIIFLLLFCVPYVSHSMDVPSKTARSYRRHPEAAQCERATEPRAYRAKPGSLMSPTCNDIMHHVFAYDLGSPQLSALPPLSSVASRQRKNACISYPHWHRAGRNEGPSGAPYDAQHDVQ